MRQYINLLSIGIRMFLSRGTFANSFWFYPYYLTIFIFSKCKLKCYVQIFFNSLKRKLDRLMIILTLLYENSVSFY